LRLLLACHDQLKYISLMHDDDTGSGDITRDDGNDNDDDQQMRIRIEYMKMKMKMNRRNCINIVQNAIHFV
jgi:hypothetical protein